MVKGMKAAAAKAMTKDALVKDLAASAELKTSVVTKLLGKLADVCAAEVKKAGVFTIPGLARIRTRRKPATQATKRMMFGKETLFKAKPAKTLVKAFATAALKSAISNDAEELHSPPTAVVYITGVSGGIGREVANRFVAEGAIVTGSDLQDHAPDGFPGSYYTCDVTSEMAQTEVVKQIIAQHGRIDACVTCAGISIRGPVHLLKFDVWKNTQDVNLSGTFLTCKAVLPHMMKRRSGSIIVIASALGLEAASEGAAAYSASKGGCVLLAKNIASDYGYMGIRCNALCPGYIETPFTAKVCTSEAGERLRKQHKLGRFGQPEEVASVVSFLAGSGASFITGAAIPVDGGYTAGHSIYYGMFDDSGNLKQNTNVSEMALDVPKVNDA